MPLDARMANLSRERQAIHGNFIVLYLDTTFYIVVSLDAPEDLGQGEVPRMAFIVVRKIGARHYWSVRDGKGRHLESLGSSPTPERIRAVVARYRVTLPPTTEIETEPVVIAALHKEE